MNEQLLEYFERELQFLAEAGPEFARRYPEIGAQLEMPDIADSDPHMERMVQAFALLNARIHLHMDRDLSLLVDALYSVIFPYAQRPLPSCAVVQLAFRAGSPPGSDSVTIPRGTALETDPVNGMCCRFQTCFSVSLNSIELHAAQLEPLTADGAPDFAPEARSVLRITLRAGDGQTISFRNTPRLRMFVQAPRQTSYPLYELLVRDSVGIAVHGETGSPRHTPGCGLVTGVGFNDDEALLPWPPGSPVGRRLLLEYFAFPEKYLFVEVGGLDRSGHLNLGRSAEVLVYLNRSHRGLENHVSSDTLLLHCTPVVNLFPQRAEPITLDHVQSAYSVRPDVRFPGGVEAFSIDRVTALTADRAVELPALYEPDRRDRARFQQAVWTSSRRQLPDRDKSAGIQLSVSDRHGELLQADEWTLDVETTCLNGDLPASLPFQGKGPRLRICRHEGVDVECITAPTHRLPPPLSGANQRKLVSLLALQSLPLVCENPDGSRLQEVLGLCNPVHTREGLAIIEGVVHVCAKQVLEEISVGTARCTCHGIEVEIEFDESRYPGGTAFLFASVLEQFLSTACSINCFSRLIMRSAESKKVIGRFPARVAQETLVSIS